MGRKEVIIIAIIFVLLIVLATYIFSSYSDSKYNDSGKKYVGNSLEECSRIKFMCENGYEFFQDGKGCGCQIVSEESTDENLAKNYCSPDSKKSQFCTQIYNPVCGWNGPEIQCIKYPCAKTYSNSCFACINEDVEYWTAGECPA